MTQKNKKGRRKNFLTWDKNLCNSNDVINSCLRCAALSFRMFQFSTTVFCCWAIWSALLPGYAAWSLAESSNKTCNWASKATKSFSKPSCFLSRLWTPWRSRPISSDMLENFSCTLVKASATSLLNRWISPAASSFWSRASRLVSKLRHASLVWKKIIKWLKISISLPNEQKVVQKQK